MVTRFGIDRERKIVRSGVRDIFTPHQPVKNRDLLFGRDDEVASLIEHMNTPGQHCLLFGERGVGKSSLANVVAPILKELTGGELYIKRCDSTDRFETIVEKPLSAVGIELDLMEVNQESTKSSGLRGGAKVAEAERRKGASVRTTHRRPPEISPGHAAEELAQLPGLLVIDEADAIASPKDRHKLAEFIKHLSDSGAELKVLIVGIAATGRELTAAHPSVGRCLSETKLGRMTDLELREIVKGGSKRCGLIFTKGSLDGIVSCSAGYPHFTHLLSLKCSENAIATDRTKVAIDHVVEATESARSDAEGTLKEAYEDTCRSHGTDMYRVVLVAAASLEAAEFSAEELRAAIGRHTGSRISQGALNNYFLRLVANDESRILRRMAKGVYRFSDPRMPSYVRIANRMV